MCNVSSYHRIKSVRAVAYLNLASTPVTIDLESPDPYAPSSQIVLHLDNVDLAAALVEAINGAVLKVMSCAA